MLRRLLLVLALLVFAQLPEGQTHEVVFPRRLHIVYKRDTQSVYPDVLQYEIPLRGKPTVIHIEKTEGLFAENYTESHYLEDGTLVTSRPEHQKENLWITKKYIELFIVADLSMYNKFGRHIDNVKMHLFGVVNYMNKVYKTINIFVALIGIEIWDTTDQIEVVSDYNVLLQRFQEWRIQNLLPRKPHDNAQFITDVDFDGSTVGLATVSAMCESKSAGVSQDHSSVAASVGSTVAHEMGHNLGMYHDLKTCTCEAPVCVMSAVLSFRPPLAFTSCSTADLRTFIYTYFPDCLLNFPQTSQLLAPPVCGNKFIENGEQCDCGEPQIKGVKMQCYVV
ncbi:zinc metalloproteinase-disintegrin-like MTP9 [Dendrobates tinctorius]|uniref:zinc metalloproteinase-disintegrin-like MTP9 n=1 Tax=Dendrobates tinctorius TaxID=92724 RepID=UPI003CC9365D